MRFDSRRAAAAAAFAFAFVLLMFNARAQAAQAEFREGRQAWTITEIQVRSGGKPGKQLGSTLPAGTHVDLLADWIASSASTTRWWRVQAASGTGWVPESALTLERPAQAAEPDEYAALPRDGGFEAPAAGEDRTADLTAHWNAIRNGTVEERLHHCQLLPYSGHDDPRFFDLLDAWLNARYERARKTELAVEADVSRCLQGLASSGGSKYQATLARWSASPELGRAARKFVLRAQVFLSESNAFNPVINRTDTHVDGRAWATTRAINMIQSGMSQLQREAMRRIKKDPRQHAAAFNVLEQQLAQESQNLDLGDGVRIDIVGWSCKTLSLTHDRKYLATLQKVADTHKDNFRIRRNCAGSIEHLLSPADAADGTDGAGAEDTL